jgi:hypothetical protein
MRRSLIAVLAAVLAPALMGGGASSAQAQQSYGCVPNDTTLCLGDGARFEVVIEWWTEDGNTGMGHAVPLTHADGTPITGGGWFWFFDQENPEIVVKVTNACVAPFNSWWVFASALTNVKYVLAVKDMKAGTGAQWFNPQGQAATPIQNASAFKCP